MDCQSKKRGHVSDLSFSYTYYIYSFALFASAAVDEHAVDPVVAGRAVGGDNGAVGVVVGAVLIDADRDVIVVDHGAVGVDAGSVNDDVVGLIVVVEDGDGFGDDGGGAFDFDIDELHDWARYGIGIVKRCDFKPCINFYDPASSSSFM